MISKKLEDLAGISIVIGGLIIVLGLIQEPVNRGLIKFGGVTDILAGTTLYCQTCRRRRKMTQDNGYDTIDIIDKGTYDPFP